MKASRGLGLCLLLALALVVAAKVRAGDAIGLLWLCYPGAALLCVGLLLDWPLIASAGGLFYIAVGLPYWAINLVATHEAGWGSISVHLVAPVVGWLHIRRAGLPRSAKWIAAGFCVALGILCRWI